MPSSVPGSAGLLDRPVAPDHERRRVAAAADGQAGPGGGRLEPAERHGAEAALDRLAQERLVQRAQDRARRALAHRRGPHRVAGDAGQRGRRSALPAHVADGQEEVALARLERVVEVPADIAAATGRMVDGGQLDHRGRRAGRAAAGCAGACGRPGRGPGRAGRCRWRSRPAGRARSRTRCRRRRRCARTRPSTSVSVPCVRPRAVSGADDHRAHAQRRAGSRDARRRRAARSRKAAGTSVWRSAAAGVEHARADGGVGVGRVAAHQLAGELHLGRVGVRDRDLVGAVRLDEVDRAPVGQVRHDQAGEVAERERGSRATRPRTSDVRASSSSRRRASARPRRPGRGRRRARSARRQARSGRSRPARAAAARASRSGARRPCADRPAAVRPSACAHRGRPGAARSRRRSGRG